MNNINLRDSLVYSPPTYDSTRLEVLVKPVSGGVFKNDAGIDSISVTVVSSSEDPSFPEYVEGYVFDVPVRELEGFKFPDGSHSVIPGASYNNYVKNFQKAFFFKGIVPETYTPVAKNLMYSMALAAVEAGFEEVVPRPGKYSKLQLPFTFIPTIGEIII